MFKIITFVPVKDWIEETWSFSKVRYPDGE